MGGAIVGAVALVAGIVAVGGAGGDAPAPAASAGSPVIEDHSANTVVDTEWLAANLDDPDVAVIEVSTEPGLYERGHIPGATNYVWTTDFVSTVNRDVVSREDFTELTRRTGIDPDTTVVLYGDRDNWFAAWGAWVFTLYGHENVTVLDGGRGAWEAEGRPLSVDAPAAGQGTWEAAEADPDLRAFLPEVIEIARAAESGGTTGTDLVDIRGAAEFSGEIFAPEGFQETAVRAGHIPGAVNVAWAEAVDEDGRFKPVDELREIYAAQGVDGSRPVVVYCRIGERASHTWFVLSQILGYDVKLYDGSWTEYGNTVGVPVVNEAGTVWGVA
ncbi:sulfurtransferase [Pseudonocardia nematodicida]|uniref:sulfurtransferase n=1 Tax=Pseudonocardia nematodicida TaxID=1206997 RepID=UPI0032C44BE9